MKKKILVADDSITIQKVVELTFSEGNYEVICAGSGAAAIQRIDQSAPDIALLDVIMPESDGYEVCAHIKKSPSTAWMPVLLLTGTFEPFDEKRAAEAGANDHLRKPFESRALVARVEQLLAAHPRPGTAAGPAPKAEPIARGAAVAAPRPAPPEPEVPGQTIRMKASEVLGQAPAGPGGPPPPRIGASTAPAPPEMVEKAVREAVAGISEKIIREVAWEVIPDLAEAIIRRRIRELEEEAENRD